MGSRFKLWTHVPMKDMLNIVHIHVNDTSDSVAFEVKYLKQSEYPDAQDHGKAQLFDFSKEEFSVDETGQKLRYKVLVKDEAVFAVLYNTGQSVESILFTETRICTEELVPLNAGGVLKRLTHEVDLKTAGDVYGRISHVPIAMMAAKDTDKLQSLVQGQTKSMEMVGQCVARTFERLLGYVDFEAISTDGCLSFCEPRHFAVPACMCEQANLEAI